jgi:hypothetical protein
VLTKRRSFLGVLSASILGLLTREQRAEAGNSTAGQMDSSPAGTWVMTSSRTDGSEGTVLLALTSDGTFLRIGDAHPVESPGVGAWTQVSAREFDITYMALQFDAEGQLVRTRQTSLRLTMNAAFDEFAGITSGGNILQGRRFRAEPFM